MSHFKFYSAIYKCLALYDISKTFKKNIDKSKLKTIKKARHPVGLFRIWLLDMTPVVSHDPDA